MKGDATTAQMFGEIFRNIFGWSATRPQELPENIYDELYDIYVEDKNGLGLEEYFDRVNPAAFQEMTATMLESARKHYWDADKKQLAKTAELHARITEKHGAPCTEFVCANAKLQQFSAELLPDADASNYRQTIAKATGSNGDARILKEERMPSISSLDVRSVAIYLAGALILMGLVAFAIVYVRKRRVKK